MILSGLILLPLLAVPTLYLLQKEFQIKLFYGLVSFVHFVLAIGLLTKHGYLFEGSVLVENMPLNKDLGLNYALALKSSGVIFITAFSAAYFILGLMSFGSRAKRDSILLMCSLSIAMLSILSANLILSVVAIFAFLLVSLTDKILLASKPYTYYFLFLGFILLSGVSLVFGLLYSSIYQEANLNLGALVEMRTPFVKGSLYSTQFVLSVLFSTGCALYLLFSLSALSSHYNRNRVFLPLIGVTLILQMSSSYFVKLFPEVSSVYFPVASVSCKSCGALTVLIFACVVFSSFFKAFSKRVDCA